MATKSGVDWYYDTLTPGLAAFPVVMDAAVGEVMERLAQQVQDYMHQNAPWSDRTGDARSGLTAEADEDTFLHYITLFHTVDYGVWLEVRWSGRYAIIVPTIEAMGPVVMAEIEGLMDFL